MVKLLTVNIFSYILSCFLCGFEELCFTIDLTTSSARVILDRETGRSRGFGFITFTSGEEASTAITAMDGKVLRIFDLYSIWLCKTRWMYMLTYLYT